jgi:(2S)-methylsuccinyl-CoA dehydrogenase
LATALSAIRPEVGAGADVWATTRAALDATDALFDAAKDAVWRVVAPAGRIDAALLDREQFAAHGLAWLEIYRQALHQMRGWAERLDAEGALGERERLMLEAAFGEYLARIRGGIPMSQVEIVRPHDLYLDEAAIRAFADDPAVQALIRDGNNAASRIRLATLIEAGDFGAWGLGDETLEMIREQFERFSDDKVIPFAHGWHERDELIPLPLIEELGELGVFGLTLPEEHGGLGMGKVAMCVVTEELSRGYIGVGSLPTRSEIAGELIRLGGTEEQKARFLPKIASGEIIPTAVFTEPDTGSDLASLKTRAVRDAEGWSITGAKTWITHAARADLMTVLCRTRPEEAGYKGLSMLLAEKPRGTESDPFPVDGLTGGEIEVLGYRGMKEYTLGFDGFRVAGDNLLGGVEGQGFKQLMATFEGARIQTAARAVGVGCHNP